MPPAEPTWESQAPSANSEPPTVKATEAIQLRRRRRRAVVSSVADGGLDFTLRVAEHDPPRFLAAREIQIAVPPSGTSQATRVVNGPPPLCSRRAHSSGLWTDPVAPAGSVIVSAPQRENS